MQFGLAPILRSMAGQRQEEVDIFMSDASRGLTGKNKLKYDIAAFDISRSRDFGEFGNRMSISFIVHNKDLCDSVAHTLFFCFY
jgi:hypothetical protein